MNISCSSAKLKEALQIVTRALPQRSTNQVYENIFIQSAEDSIYLTCSDERFTIRTQIDAEIQEHGAMLVPGRLFNDIVRTLPDGDAVINTNNAFLTTIKISGSCTNISGIDPSLFPHLPSLSGSTEVTLPQSLLRQMIEKTEFAIDPQNMREILTGEFIEMADGKLTLVGLDGYRMAVRTDSIGDEQQALRAIVPVKVMGDLAKLLSNDPDEMASLSFTKDKLGIRLGATSVFSSLIGGEYVAYRQIVPPSFATIATVDTVEMRYAIERAALIARNGSNNLVRLEIAQDEISIDSRSDIANTHQHFPLISLTGSPITVNFNVRYLSDVLKNVEGDRIEICLNSSVKPCVIREEGKQDYYHLVLPVRA